jgi:hypothetical protein
MRAMSSVRSSSLYTLLSLALSLACSRRTETPSTPAPLSAPAVPAATATAGAEPSPADAAAIAPTATEPAAPEPELPAPVRACNRRCSSEANHRQMEGFVRCEKAAKGPECKQAVLAANDAERASCRKACEAKARK